MQKLRIEVTVDDVTEGDKGPLDTADIQNSVEAFVLDWLEGHGHDSGPVIVMAEAG